MKLSVMGPYCVTLVALASCSTNDGPAQIANATPLLLQSNAVFYMRETDNATRGIERDVPLSGLPQQNQLRLLLVAAGQDRVDWTTVCAVVAGGSLQNCRVTDVYPDTYEVRAVIAPLLPPLRVALPAVRRDQQPESFAVGMRVTTRLNQISMDEPCAATFFCPRIESSPPPPVQPR